MSSSTYKRRARSRESSGYNSASECENVQKKFKQEEEEIKKQAKELVEMIDCIMKCLDGHHNNVNIAKVIGSAAAVLGGACSLLGAIFAPATGGTSLVAAAIASSISAAGGTISGGASLTEFVITKGYLKDMDTCMKKLQDRIRHYKALADNLARKGVDISFLTGVTEAAIGTVVAMSGLEQILTITTEATSAATKTVETVTTFEAASLAFETVQAAESGAAVAAEVAGKAAEAAVLTGRSAASASKATFAAASGVSKTTTTSAAQATGQTVVKGVGKGIIFLNAILIPVSIYDMYQAATELRASQGSSACPGLILLKEQLGEVAKGNFTSSV